MYNMCWMCARQGENAGERAVEAVRRHEESNGHSWGVASVVEEDGETRLQIDKGVGEIPEEYEPPETRSAIAHTRFATRGVINVENAHPFAIEQDGEAVAALAHNGTWREAPRVPGKCDSRFIAERIEDHIDEFGLAMAVKAVAGLIGETILVIGADGTIYAYSGRFDITMEPDGARISSTGEATRIPEGRVVRMQ